MGVILYANGLTEEIRPKESVFTDKELLVYFNKFDKIKTYRIFEVPNTWCIWGEYNNIKGREDEFNRLGSGIVDNKCYSPIIFLHDTEIDESWNLTDNVIYKSYDEFKREFLSFLDAIAIDILREAEILRREMGESPNFMRLEQIGVSSDKRIIFSFDFKKQNEEFFHPENIREFAKKVHEFLNKNYKDGEVFAVYADKNMILTLKDSQVGIFLNKIMSIFETMEEYEKCETIKKVYERWLKYKEKKEAKNDKNKKPNKNI